MEKSVVNMTVRLNPHHPPYSTISDSNMASPSSGEFIDEQDDYKTQPTVADEESRAPTGPLSDEERLRMLGYDVSLGRPLGFWGSAGMNVCHNSWIFDFIMYTAMYAKAGPLLFVSKRHRNDHYGSGTQG